MSRPFPDDPFLRGNYAPYPMEGEIHDCVVEGELPRELDGTLYRNGPNPQYAPRGRYHWFDGDGMIHAFAIHDGRVAYRNRWVRTARFALERGAREGLFGGLADMAKTDLRAAATSPNTANTNIVLHAGRLLALWEGGLPYALDPRTLETIGPFDFRGSLAGPMTAHPKLDPETGEMLFFGYAFAPPFLRYHVVAKDGTLIRSEEIEVAVPTMMHDFIATREHVIFLVCPATLRLENIEKTGSPLGWEPELGTRIGASQRGKQGRRLVHGRPLLRLPPHERVLRGWTHRGGRVPLRAAPPVRRRGPRPGHGRPHGQAHALDARPRGRHRERGAPGRNLDRVSAPR